MQGHTTIVCRPPPTGSGDATELTLHAHELVVTRVTVNDAPARVIRRGRIAVRPDGSDDPSGDEDAALAVSDAGALTSGASIARNACEGMLADARAVADGFADELVIALEDGGVIASGGSSEDVVVRVWYGAGTAMNAVRVQAPGLVEAHRAARGAPAYCPGGERRGGRRGRRRRRFRRRRRKDRSPGRSPGGGARRRVVRGLVQPRGRGDVRLRRFGRGERAVPVRAGLRASSRGVVPVRRRRRFVGSLQRRRESRPGPHRGSPGGAHKDGTRRGDDDGGRRQYTDAVATGV